MRQPLPGTFILWADHDHRKHPKTKIEEGIAHYADQFGVEASLVLVHPAEACAVQGVEVRTVARVKPGTYQIGQKVGG